MFANIQPKYEPIAGQYTRMKKLLLNFKNDSFIASLRKSGKLFLDSPLTKASRFQKGSFCQYQ